MFKIVIRNGKIILVARRQVVATGLKTTIVIPKYHRRKNDVLMAEYRDFKRAASEYIDAVLHSKQVLKWAANQ
jgi:hypothetical protein